MIDRHNYEEFFLLYADNELTQADRAAVDAFVQQNPDLVKELTLLQQSILMPDEDVQFVEKDNLYKREHSINIANYEEYFLLNVDNELKPEEKNEVEKFVLQHPQLQDEFTLIQQTKLQPEHVEFKNKASLYRTSERRVIPLTWMRMAAAAAITGLVATLWLTFGDSTKTAQPVAINKTNNKQPKTLQPKITVAEKVQPQQQIAATENATKKEVTIAKKQEQANDLKQVATTAKENKKGAAVDPGNLNQLPVPENNPYVARNPKKDNDAQTIEDRPARTYGTTPQDAVAAKNNSNETTGSLVTHTVYKEMNNEGEEDKTLYIGGAEINRNKLRGLFKKAATFFDKKIKKNDDGNVQIAGFEIKTK